MQTWTKQYGMATEGYEVIAFAPVLNIWFRFVHYFPFIFQAKTSAFYDSHDEYNSNKRNVFQKEYFD